MHGKTYIIVSETDIKQWISEKYGISIKFNIDVLTDTSELMLRGEIDPRTTTFDTIKRITQSRRVK